jgi:hypothetical protein
MLHRRIVPINKSGLTFLKWIEYPTRVAFVDDENIVHIYRLVHDHDLEATLVVSAFSRHYAFVSYATAIETKAWFADQKKFRKECNSIGSQLQN